MKPLKRAASVASVASAASVLGAVALVALLHCGDDDELKITCTSSVDHKTCDCTPGTEVLGFCNPSAGIPSPPAICCAQDGWPAKNLHCMCDQIVCVVTGDTCKCGRASERNPQGEEVATCPTATNDATRCCLDKAGNCGCYLKTADQCGDGATDVATCDYNATKPACPAAQHTATTCEQ